VTARWLVLCSAVVLLGACGEGATPCTDCPPVAGRYRMEAAPVAESRSSCGQLSFSGMSLTIDVSQEKEKITLTGPWTIKGTLYDNLEVTFEPFEALTNQGDKGTMQLTGTFSGEEKARRLDGTFLYQLNDGSCTLNIPNVVWTQVE